MALTEAVLALATLLSVGPVAHSEDSPDTRGPVANAGMKVVAQSDGVRAPDYRCVLVGDKQGPWKAKWIVAAGGEGDAILLRKEVVLDAAPTSVRSWLTAGARYRLYVNGVLADRGPADRGSDFSGASNNPGFYDCRDLTPLFHKGRNTITAVVYDHAAPFVFQAQVDGRGHAPLVIVSDETWRGARTTSLSDGGFTFDASREPVGWTSAAYDDSRWSRAVEAPAVPYALVPSQLPPCMEIRYPASGIDRASTNVIVPQRPFESGHSVVVTGNGSFAVRFDRILSAYIGIKVKGGAGASIELQPNETNTPGASNRVSKILLRDGVQFYESPGFASVGVINVVVRNVKTPVEIQDISADFTSQPVDYEGSFECSDPKLNAIWSSSRWSTEICMQTWHLDSPQHQEPISDYGDYLIADRVTFDAFGNNSNLARQDLRKWAWVMKERDYRTFHTSYTLLWLQSLLQYYDFTGDSSVIHELSPYVFELLDRFKGYIGKNGLISEAPNYMFMDWVKIDGFECHHPPAVIGQGYMTAFYYRALADGMRVAELLGDTGKSESYRRQRADVAAAYNRALWSPAKGLYRDGKPFQTTVAPYQWLPADANIETFSAQNNVLAVLYDLAPPERQKMVIANTMAQTPWNVRPYFMHFVLDAIGHAGLFNEYGTARLREWQINPDTQTSREMGDQGDLSHGWIATPLCQMSEKILGITPKSPGYATISIKPELCDLSWAKGRVPTPRGPVDVSWKRSARSFSMDVSIPKGAVADVVLPGVANGSVIRINGKVLQHPRATGDGATVPHEGKQTIMDTQIRVGEGRYAISVE